MTRSQPYRIAIGADHAGFALKQKLVTHLQSLGHTILDLGTHSEAAVDYPDIAHDVAGRLRRKEADRGVLVCGSAIGMAIAANRHPGVRAAVVRDAHDARMSREHNDTNIVCFGGRVTPPELATQLVDLWLTTEFAGGRHIPRIEKIERKKDTP